MTSHRIPSEGKDVRPLHMIAGTVAMVLVIGTIDYVTGSQVSIAPLYLVPIAPHPGTGRTMAAIKALWSSPRQPDHDARAVIQDRR